MKITDEQLARLDETPPARHRNRGPEHMMTVALATVAILGCIVIANAVWVRISPAECVLFC